MKNCRIEQNQKIGVELSKATKSVTECHFSKNGFCGALITQGTLTVDRCTFVENKKYGVLIAGVINSDFSRSSAETGHCAWGPVSHLYWMHHSAQPNARSGNRGGI